MPRLSKLTALRCRGSNVFASVSTSLSSITEHALDSLIHAPTNAIDSLVHAPTHAIDTLIHAPTNAIDSLLHAQTPAHGRMSLSDGTAKKSTRHSFAEVTTGSTVHGWMEMKADGYFTTWHSQYFVFFAQSKTERRISMGSPRASLGSTRASLGSARASLGVEQKPNTLRCYVCLNRGAVEESLVLKEEVRIVAIREGSPRPLLHFEVPSPTSHHPPAYSPRLYVFNSRLRCNISRDCVL